MKLLLSLLLFIFGYTAQGQNGKKTVANQDSSLVTHFDERYEQLLAKHREQNVNKQSMPGYRIQIYFGGNRQKAAEVKLDFASKYPDVPAYISYQQPNFKVRVGDYRHRMEAQKFLKNLDGQYPTMFIVPDEVKLPPVR